jgi:hypothetical protein
VLVDDCIFIYSIVVCNHTIHACHKERHFIILFVYSQVIHKNEFYIIQHIHRQMIIHQILNKRVESMMFSISILRRPHALPFYPNKPLRRSLAVGGDRGLSPRLSLFRSELPLVLLVESILRGR